MKKIITFLLSIMMLCMYSPVFAEDYNKDTPIGFYPSGTPAFTFEIDEPADDVALNHTHVYKIYQVLKGDLYVQNNTTEPVLSNIEFGDGVNVTELLKAVKGNAFTQEQFAKVGNASEFADTLRNSSAVAQLLAGVIGQNVVPSKGKALTYDPETYSYKYTGDPDGKLAPGYYVVIDTPATNVDNPTPAARIITAVVGNVKLETKPQKLPEVSKSVADANDSTLKENFPMFDKTTSPEAIATFGVNSKDSADHDIGDKIVFTLRAELPNEEGDGTANNHFTGYRQFKKYKIVFHDTMSKGLTFEEPKLKLSLIPTVNNPSSITDGEKGAIQSWIRNHYGNVNVDADDDVISNNLRVFVTDDKDASGSKVEYPIIPKSVYDLLDNYYVEDGQNFHVPGSFNNVVKYGQLGPAMDAKGIFYKENCFYYEAKLNADGTTSLTVGIDDTMGICRADQTIRVVYNATLNENAIVGFQPGNDNKVYLEYTNSDANDSTGNTGEDLVRVWTYRLNLHKVDQDNNELKGADFLLEKLVWNSTTQSYDRKPVDVIYGNPKGVKGTDWFTREMYVTEDVLDENAFNAKLNQNSVFNYIGIDDGFYVLSEKKTPNGYNTMKDRYFVVQAEHVLNSSNPTVTSYSVTEVKNLNFDTTDPIFTYSNEDMNGVIDFNVVNKKGVVLPATGGIGTTIFYVGGSVLVVAAAVALVVNKKTKNNN